MAMRRAVPRPGCCSSVRACVPWGLRARDPARACMRARASFHVAMCTLKGVGRVMKTNRLVQVDLSESQTTSELWIFGGGVGGGGWGWGQRAAEAERARLGKEREEREAAERALREAAEKEAAELDVRHARAERTPARTSMRAQTHTCALTRAHVCTHYNRVQTHTRALSSARKCPAPDPRRGAALTSSPSVPHDRGSSTYLEKGALIW